MRLFSIPTADLLSKDTQPSSKPGRFGSLGQVQQAPVYGLDGDRQISGASLAQAFMRNMGTWRSDAKGETQKGSPRKGQSTNAERRGGPPRSSEEAAVMAVERRGWAIQFRLGQLMQSGGTRVSGRGREPSWIARAV